jgi:hypothetical protein
MGANGDETDGDQPASSVTTVVLKREPRTLAGGPVGDETIDPNDEPERIPFPPTPAPSHAVAQNGDPRAPARVRAR